MKIVTSASLFNLETQCCNELLIFLTNLATLGQNEYRNMLFTCKHMPGKLMKSIFRFASYYPQFAFGYDNRDPTISMSVKPSCFTVDIALVPC